MNTFGRLLCDLGGHAGLAALDGHLPQFIRHRAELAGGRVAARDELADAVELPLGAEFARVRLELAQGPPDERRDYPAWG